MNDFQVLITVLMALVVGFVVGRGSKNKSDSTSQKITPEEWASLQPDHNHNPYDDVHPEVLNALNANNKIKAIKLFRQYHSASLKEAKNAIDAIFKNFN